VKLVGHLDGSNVQRGEAPTSVGPSGSLKDRSPHCRCELDLGQGLSCCRKAVQMGVNDRETDSWQRPAAKMPVQRNALVHVDQGMTGDLQAWGHAGHLVLLQRVVGTDSGAPAERCLFWCESCKLWLLARLAEPDDG